MCELTFQQLWISTCLAWALLPDITSDKRLQASYQAWASLRRVVPGPQQHVMLVPKHSMCLYTSNTAPTQPCMFCCIGCFARGTGHSLGGGVAALVTLLLQQPGAAPRGISGVRCVCIGPAAVLSQELCSLCEQYVTSVVVGADAIPRLRWERGTLAVTLEWGAIAARVKKAGGCVLCVAVGFVFPMVLCVLYALQRCLQSASRAAAIAAAHSSECHCGLHSHTTHASFLSLAAPANDEMPHV